MVELRPVRPDDWAFWRNLHHVAEHDTIVRQFHRFDEAVQDTFARDSWDDTEGERAVVVVDGVDAGWWHLKEVDGGYFLNNIVLRPDVQNRGIGRALMTGLIERAKRENKQLTLQTLLQNTAKQLYEKLGFEVTGQTETHWVMAWRG